MGDPALASTDELAEIREDIAGRVRTLLNSLASAPNGKYTLVRGYHASHSTCISCDSLTNRLESVLLESPWHEPGHSSPGYAAARFLGKSARSGWGDRHTLQTPAAQKHAASASLQVRGTRCSRDIYLVLNILLKAAGKTAIP